MPDKAAAYMELALWGIKTSGGPASALRQWWVEERRHREDYGLSEVQIETLIEACRVRVDELGPETRHEPKPQPRSSQSRYRQGSLI